MSIFSPLLKSSSSGFATKWVLVAIASPVSIAIASFPAFAQESEPTALCAANLPSESASIVVKEVDGDTTFVYANNPTPFDASAVTTESVLLTDERTMTFANTSIDQARQHMLSNPAYYAALVGVSEGELPDPTGFRGPNDRLICESRTATEVPQPPATTTPETPAETPTTPPETPAEPPSTPPQNTLADLPNGNYRVTSADLPFKVVETQEILGSNVFLFRKSGDAVVGYFYEPETDIFICIDGTLAGNVVSGTAKGPGAGSEGTIPQSDALTLGDQSMGGRFGEATLNLEGFSRINAGTVLPPETCG